MTTEVRAIAGKRVIVTWGQQWAWRPYRPTIGPRRGLGGGRGASWGLRQQGGSIVNIGSTVVDRAPLDRFGYVASKGGVEGMTRALAGDLGPDRIRVNLVRPGIVPSELRGMSEEEEAEALKQKVPRLQALEAVGAGTDVAAVVAFLVSDQAAWITGTVIDVDGGHVLGIPR